jgi:hypothetical protein
MAAQKPHMFDQCAWRLIKDFGGIYGIKMNYSKVPMLSKDKIVIAYFDVAELSLEPFEMIITQKYKYTKEGSLTIPERPRYENGTVCNEQIRPKTATEWKRLILKRAAQGYKNRKFYEALAALLIPPPKETCVCGLKMGLSQAQKYRHYQTPSHIRRMLTCVPVKSVECLRTLPEPRVLSKQGHPYKICLKKPWVNQPQYHDYKTLSLLPIMVEREKIQEEIDALTNTLEFVEGDDFKRGLEKQIVRSKSNLYHKVIYYCDELKKDSPFVNGWKLA